ncbi:Hint domain-containing protein [Roseovarius tolerans]|uniref:Hint domain-containing protein n=1 Tax=Roseovarius tolerans TaxID=74031 RepID=A0A1H7UCU0_9RHOB|nr:Hint domain-containing protein [Roseovarius tolerans]SEL94515.1 Hint domain-containing protein [Roseovarius tolerans]
MKPNTVRRTGGDLAVMPAMEASGLCADSIILTLDGETRVRDLRPGARVITRDSGTATLRAVDRRRSACRAVHIRAGSLGHTRPEHDVTLPATQPILVRDWRAHALFGAGRAMVPAERLVDGEFVTLRPTQVFDLYHLIFDQPHILYVDGLELASMAQDAD